MVAISGDTVVVGTFGEDSSATGIDGDQGDNSAEFSGAAYVFDLDLTPESSPITITESALMGTDFVIHFTSEAGLTGWKVTGSDNLLNFPNDKTAASTISETSPGVYKAVVDVSGEPGRYFLRIER